VGSKCSQCTQCTRSIQCLTCSDLLSSLCALGSYPPDAMKRTGMYNNSVIVVCGDNGGPTFEGHSNTPLRGGKLNVRTVHLPCVSHLHTTRSVLSLILSLSRSLSLSHTHFLSRSLSHSPTHSHAHSHSLNVCNCSFSKAVFGPPLSSTPRYFPARPRARPTTAS
jgi:hypothetical protein